MNILAIETSCDETAIAILNITGSKQKPVFRLLSNVVLSQIKIHKPFGGVVPNLAQREHQKNLPFILKTALQEAKLLVNSGQRPVTRKKTKKDKLQLITNHSSLVTILNREPELWRLFQKHILPLKSPPIDAVAVTHGPGLESALWVGINFAKALAVLWEKPLIPVNHLEGHIYASWLVPLAKSKIKNQKSKLQIKSEKKKTHHLSLITHHYPKFPLLALIVSGGHTELVLIKKHLHYKILGETRDDAAGEAFDKVAKMLGLGYPGGPKISRLAGDGNPTSIKFPRPMINSNNYDFSFSGLKTAVLYYLKNKEAIRLPLGNRIAKSAERSDIAASFEQAVIDALIAKTAKALEHYNMRTLVVGGGVAANTKLRSSLETLITNHYPLVTLCLSPLWLCGDNAAMIAVAAYFRSFQKKKFDIANLRANGNLRLHD